jgi:hypothetical protein
VTIRIDRDGDVTTRPTTSANAAAEAFDVGLLTFVALSMFATMTFLLFRSRLDRSRLRQWAADWAVVEPVWTRKVSRPGTPSQRPEHSGPAAEDMRPEAVLEDAGATAVDGRFTRIV